MTWKSLNLQIYFSEFRSTVEIFETSFQMMSLWLNMTEKHAMKAGRMEQKLHGFWNSGGPREVKAIVDSSKSYPK